MHKIADLDRRNLNFSTSRIEEVLPEYFVESYPNLVAFLAAYYDYLEGDAIDSFKTEINQLFLSRDIQQTSLKNLDFLIQEIGNGLQAGSFFQNPRLMATLLTKFYRVKGSLASTEGFFRAFFNDEVEIEYPKRQMFIIGQSQSQIGYESLKFIQDNGLYQVFSILIKSAIPVADYGPLYKRFAHPAGFHFRGQLTLSSNGIIDVTSPGIEDPLDSNEPIIIISNAPAIAGVGLNIMSGVIDSDGRNYRVNLQELVSMYASVTAEQLNKFYSSVAELLSANSFTFDDSISVDSGPDMSMTTETMDNDMHTRYTSDSAY